jgi:hypothetical protein
MVKFLKSLLSFSYKSNLEEYLLSKNVKTNAEVEYWINQYTRGTKVANF